MSLTDIIIPAKTVTDDANAIRHNIGQAVEVTDHCLNRVRHIVRVRGRAAIAAELGDDAPALLTVFTKLKEAIEAAKDITV